MLRTQRFLVNVQRSCGEWLSLVIVMLRNMLTFRTPSDGDPCIFLGAF
jgi:hypothetical protein